MQPDEEVGGGQAQSEPAQIDQQTPDNDPIEEVAIYEDGSGLADESQVEKEPAVGQAASADPDTAKEEPKVESPEMVRLRELEKKLADVNKALHQERQKKKEEKTEESLTPEQIQQIIRDHGDDPATMYNVFDYMSKQAAKQATKETVDVQKTQQMRQAGEVFIQNKWPALMEPESDLRKRVDAVKTELNLADHPMADAIGASFLTALHIDDIKKHWYEAGKTEALKVKSEAARKDDVAAGGLMKSSSPFAGKKPAANSGADAVIAQLQLSPSAAKVYRSLIAKKSNMVEA